jgi:uncharacterized protein YkwD
MSHRGLGGIAWSGFRRWPVWGQLIAWVVLAFLVFMGIGGIGAALGVGAEDEERTAPTTTERTRRTTTTVSTTTTTTSTTTTTTTTTTLLPPPPTPPPPPPPPPPFGNASAQARELYFLVNNERAAHGLGPVNWNDQLGGLAQGWSQHMAATGSMAHQNLQAILNSGFGGFSGLAENVFAGGCGMSAGQMHHAWMNSPTHRANILGGFSAIGIGIACNGGALYATEEFGR